MKSSMLSRISAIVPMLLATAVVVAIAPARADDPSSAPVKSIHAVLQPFVDNHTLAGAVTLVADKDKVLGLDAVGFADIAGNKPMRTDAMFWIASQSKPITATALMILVDEGKLRIDDPVEKYLPEFKDIWVAAEKDNEHVLLKRPKRPITIRDVMSHTSGMPFRSVMEQPTIDVLPLRDAVRSYAMTSLQTEPGTKYAYSNAGINTGGRIIEVVSGVPYEEFLQKRLFDPLGMKETTFWPSEDQVKRLAKSYKPNSEKNGLEETTITALRYPLSDAKRYPCPGGGLFSTASDLANFCQMVLDGGTFKEKRLLSEDAIKTMTSKQTGDDLKEGYGLGWSKNGGVVGHGGAYSTNMSIDTKRGLITIYMVQHAGWHDDGNKSRDQFQKAAEELFANKK
jgi:CubicO group peptidase (beta-lactamase class C family)